MQMFFCTNYQIKGTVKELWKCRAKAKEAKNKMCEHGKRKTQCDECISNQIMMSKKINMDSTNNNSFEIAAKKVFSDYMIK